jgi:hypothetical protein
VHHDSGKDIPGSESIDDTAFFGCHTLRPMLVDGYSRRLTLFGGHHNRFLLIVRTHIPHPFSWFCGGFSSRTLALHLNWSWPNPIWSSLRLSWRATPLQPCSGALPNVRPCGAERSGTPQIRRVLQPGALADSGGCPLGVGQCKIPFIWPIHGCLWAVSNAVSCGACLGC